MSFFSRRSLFQGAAALALAPTLARAQVAPKPSAVVLVYLEGGYNALFSSPKNFAGAGSFGVSAGNIRSLGNELFVDDATFGQKLPAVALSRMATIGVNHRLSSHLTAQLAHWSGTNQRSHPLMLANALGGAGAGKLPCVVVGTGRPQGEHPSENGISLQRASDLAPTLDLFGVGTSTVPALSRRAAVAGMQAARAQSAARVAANPNSLRTGADGYSSAISVLNGQAASFDFAAMQADYGVTGTAVSSFTHQMLAAETMIRLGTKVCIAVNGGWDTHGDINGTTVRTRMNTVILPGLSKFLQRMMAPASGYDVTVAILGDFARSLPGSDHASCLAATVIGPKVRTGVTANVDAQVGMSSPHGIQAFWSYLSAASGAATNPFGNNPHAGLLL